MICYKITMKEKVIVMKITYWSDYACPYCYIGEMRLEKALEKLGMKDQVELVMKSFELDPEAAHDYTGTTVDRFAVKYGLSKEGAMENINHISSLGQAEGIDFKYAQTRYTNTMDAHRLTKLVASKGNKEMTNKVIHDLFDAYFTQNLELTNRDVLMQIGVDAGLTKQEVEELLDGKRFENDVRNDEIEAYRYRVHSVPYFVIEDKYSISGAQPVELFEEALQRVVAEGLTDLSMVGASCGIDGCH